MFFWSCSFLECDLVDSLVTTGLSFDFPILLLYWLPYCIIRNFTAVSLCVYLWYFVGLIFFASKVGLKIYLEFRLDYVLTFPAVTVYKYTIASYLNFAVFCLILLVCSTLPFSPSTIHPSLSWVVRQYRSVCFSPFCCASFAQRFRPVRFSARFFTAFSLGVFRFQFRTASFTRRFRPVRGDSGSVMPRPLDPLSLVACRHVKFWPCVKAR